MERILLTNENVATCAARSAEVLRQGGIVLYPTDTLYGLGADALSDEAVAKIYAIKGREGKKPIHAILTDIEMAQKYGEFNDEAKRLAQKFWPGALTLVLKKKEGIDSGICRNLDTIGIRIPDNEFCLALAQEFGKPFTTTSANIAGQEPERSVGAILKQLDGVSHSNVLQNVRMRNIDLVIDAGELPERQPSTVVDLTGPKPVILREGVVSKKQITDALTSRGVEPRFAS